MKTKLLTIAMTAALMFTAMTKVQAQNFDGPCLPPAHGLVDHQSAFCGAMQVIALASGWNWVSFNVDITLDDLKAAIAAVVPANDRPIIKSYKNGQTQKRANNNMWMGALTQLNLSEMYMVQVSSACEITVEGMPINPADYPATIEPGANWIAYPLNVSMSVTNALANYTPTSNDEILSKGNGKATRRGTNWMGALTNLVPGQGYIYNSKATVNKTLVFPMPAKK